MKLLTTILIFSMTSMGVLFAQDFSVAGSIGWTIPGGAGVSEAPEDLNLDGGLGYNFDVLYHITESLGVGLAFSGSILAGASENGVDIDLYGTRLIGAKGLWRMKEDGFSPFVGLTLGLSQLTTPEVSSGGSVIAEQQRGSGFGIMPEVGISFGGLFISANFLVPVKYTIKDVITDKALSVTNINIGYRVNINL